MGVYRVEVSPNNRAGCHVKACKDAASKITKGEFRFAVQVTIQEHVSWQYRHWGCVTPKQIENLVETCGGDTDMVDGYDELPAEFQEKVRYALEHGHIPDEDCTRDPELNRLGVKKPRANKGDEGHHDDGAEEKTPKKKEDVHEEDMPTPAPKKRGRPPKPKVQGEEDAAVPAPAPRKRGRPPKPKVQGEEDAAVPAPTPRKRGRPRKLKAPDEGDAAVPAPAPRKRGRPRKKQVVEGEEAREEISPPAKKARANGRGEKTAEYKEESGKEEASAP